MQARSTAFTVLTWKPVQNCAPPRRHSSAILKILDGAVGLGDPMTNHYNTADWDRATRRGASKQKRTESESISVINFIDKFCNKQAHITVWQLR